MSKQRIAVAMHKDLVPEDRPRKDINFDKVLWATEYDVVQNLKEMGHDVEIMGVHDELTPMRKMISEFNPHVIFNLLEEFNNEAIFDQHVVSYFELMKTAYTGCNPRGLTLARDKSLAKKILTYHKIKTPRFFVFPHNRKIRIPKNPPYPLIVKCLVEEASLGISKASVVSNEHKFRERIEFLHETYGVDVIAERFIEGDEVYIGVLGNYQLQTFHPWSLHFDKVEDQSKHFYTNRAKFDEGYRKKMGIRTSKADLSEDLVQKLQKISKRSYRALHLNGYARMDFRIDSEGEVYLLEANPNPDIAHNDEFAESAVLSGFSYQDLLAKILTLGKGWASRHSE